jgi:DHA2 family multidrug resistance protein
MPMFFLPLNAILLSHVKPSELAAASGLSNFMRTLAGSISTALSIFLWNHRTEVHHATLTEHVRVDSAGWQHYQGILSNGGLTDQQTLGVTNYIVNQQASTMAANDLYWLFAIVFISLIPLIWLCKPPFAGHGGMGGH